MEAFTILVAVTFRDFVGSENDQIQRLFLESISKQTYTNWQLVVTLFNEKHVRQEIESRGLNAVFYTNDLPVGARFSLSDVLINAVTESQTRDKTIILWTTCDVIFKPDFFQVVVNNFSKNFFAVSHPHVMYASIERLGTEQNIPASINSGMDLMIMDGEFFKDKKHRDVITEYRFYDWGIFEHFLVGLGQLGGGKRINLFNLSSIAKIENDRAPGSETNDYLLKCWKKNKAVLDKFIANHNLSKELAHLTYCHIQFSILTGLRSHIATFAPDYYAYFKRKLHKRLLPFLAQSLKTGMKKVMR